MAPASTFKIPHALAALDARMLDGPEAMLPYDGSPQSFQAWRRDHTLRSAMRDSVVWFFQRIAERLGAAREREYLLRFSYGNADPSSGLTTFWLGGSLVISPEEQLQFLRRFFGGDLPVDRRALETVREILVQPAGFVVNAAGQHAFGSPWPAGTVVRAKTGAARDRSDRDVRWLVGQVQRSGRTWLFVSCVIGATGAEGTPGLAAVELAARSLADARVL